MSGFDVQHLSDEFMNLSISSFMFEKLVGVKDFTNLNCQTQIGQK